MKLAWLGPIFLVAPVLMACGGSSIPPPREVLLQPTSARVPGLTPTVSPFSPPMQASPAPTSTPLPMLTPTATPFLTPTASQPSPTATTIPVSSPSQEAADDQPGVPSSSLTAGEKSLAVIQNGDWKFIKNGGRVNLPNGLSAELFLDPYPPTRLTAMLDVYLTRRGQPVSNASANVAYDMKGMLHGPFMSVAKNLGNGHYQLSMDYIEFGAWEHNLVLYLPEDHFDMRVGIVVSPSPSP